MIKNSTSMKREKLLQKRVVIQKLIKEIRDDICKDYSDEITKQYAYLFIDELVDADNILNGFELKIM